VLKQVPPWRSQKLASVIRYADDTIVGFQHEHEAKAFLHDLQERMRKFELALHPTKTRLIRFGRHAAKQREELGEGRPEPFDFLGFTHFCTRSRKWGSFVIGRKTIKKRMLKQLQAVKMELRRRMHDPIAKTGAWLNLSDDSARLLLMVSSVRGALGRRTTTASGRRG